MNMEYNIITKILFSLRVLLKFELTVAKFCQIEFLNTHLLFLIADDVREIAKRYIRGDFCIDFFGAIPLQYLDCVSNGQENSVYSKLNVMVCVFLACVLVCVGARCLWSFSLGI